MLQEPEREDCRGCEAGSQEGRPPSENYQFDDSSTPPPWPPPHISRQMFGPIKPFHLLNKNICKNHFCQTFWSSCLDLLWFMCLGEWDCWGCGGGEAICQTNQRKGVWLSTLTFLALWTFLCLRDSVSETRSGFMGENWSGGSKTVSSESECNAVDDGDFTI